ncbi:hypothetical protein [Candidatus Entotheonella palauensis]|uniref:hypothetical protein n=1 Tax=Candidatus Entotheonella palauensis TaxID=93172 RepID=UPI0011777286|nr:hypothetical protein [Candidatus Entotheonella palauensis]
MENGRDSNGSEVDHIVDEFRKFTKLLFDYLQESESRRLNQFENSFTMFVERLQESANEQYRLFEEELARSRVREKAQVNPSRSNGWQWQSFFRDYGSMISIVIVVVSAAFFLGELKKQVRVTANIQEKIASEFRQAIKTNTKSIIELNSNIKGIDRRMDELSKTITKLSDKTGDTEVAIAHLKGQLQIESEQAAQRHKSLLETLEQMMKRLASIQPTKR